ncbi:amino acid adenylation domain-containing protein [Streptomyces sp. NPDC050619]|uniref:amino acid adenylation domain-containing protein n=1 Tax=Streptomyces sp. NPDC050619 TaxID=3157214 RepID=UPI0034139662
MDDKRKALLRLLRGAQAKPETVEGIAVIGLAGRYPRAGSPEELWTRIHGGENCIQEFPPACGPRARASGDGLPDGRRWWAGLIDDPDAFDPLFFGIAPVEAENMDPQERIFLETVWATLEDAGYPPRRLARENNPVGVFAGVMNSDYEWMGGQAAALGVANAARSNHWSIANRVSYVLDFRGPSLTVNTACSASLTAVHLACESLRTGGCSVAVAGGVNLILHESHLRTLSDNGMTSPGDRCRAFGKGADGFVDGEGVGAVLLKPLRRAIADGDRIYGVIRASAMNSGGKTGGYTVPSPQAQAEVIRASLRGAGIDPRTIGCVEAHGTGTPLGDPIEISGLREAFRERIDDELAQGVERCAVGSLKSNIGHLESAAGIAGLTKMLMQLRYGTVAPSLHSAEPNPDIDLTGTPFFIPQEPVPWPRPTVVHADGQRVELPRRGAISSFGGGGANAHLIVEEYRADAAAARPTAPAAAGPQLVVLSARDEERLRESAGRLAAFLERPARGTHSPRRDAERIGRVEAACLRLAAEVLEVRADDLDPATPLGEYGCGAAELALLAKKLDAEFGARPGGVSLTGSTTVREVAPLLADRAADEARAGERTGEGPERISLADLAHTLQSGREEMEARLAFPAADLDEARDLLRAFASGAPAAAVATGAAPVHRGSEQDKDRLARALREADLRTVAECWTRGAEVDWARLRPEGAVRRVGLPTYPFARKSYWLPPLPGPTAPSAGQVVPDSSGVGSVPAASFAGQVVPDSSGVGSVSAASFAGQAAPHPSAVGPAPAASSAAHSSVAGRPDQAGHGLARREPLVPPVAGLPDAGAHPVGAAAVEPSAMVCYRPAWVPEQRPVSASGAGGAGGAGAERVLILSSRDAAPLAEGIARHHRDDDTRLIDLDQDDLARALAEAGVVDRVYHLGGIRPYGPGAAGEPGELEDSGRRGVLALFRVARHLTDAGDGRRVHLKIVTSDAAAAFGDPVANPFAAGLHGLARVLPKERPEIRAVCLDFSQRETAEGAAAGEGLLEAVLDEPCDSTGRTVLLRHGVRYAPALQPVALPQPQRPPYREHGVYVIVGGTGGIGRELTLHLAERYRAKVVWISRGPLGDEQRACADRARGLGGEVLHLRADCRDAADLRRAAAEVKARFGSIHGVVHAAMTFEPGPLAALDERAFRAALSVKADGSVAIDQVFGAEPLDFLVFFSSVGALAGTAGNGTYSCAGALQDAYALHLGHRRPYPVRVIDWGYWGPVGSGARPGLREIFRDLGVGELSVADGLSAISRVLGNRLPQVLPISASGVALAALGAASAPPAELASADGAPTLRTASSQLLRPRTGDAPGVDSVISGYQALTEVCRPAVLGVFQRMGALVNPGDSHDRRELPERLGILPKYRRLYEALLNILRDAGYVEFDGGRVRLLTDDNAARPYGLGALEPEFDRIAADHPDLASTVTLTRLFLQSYPQILRGEIRATEIMFPGSSMALVEDFYKANPLTDSFNQLVRDAAGAYLEHRIGQLAPGERLRVVEFGAGTGATTETVLPVLARYADRVSYWFTDISPIFLEHAEARFRAEYGTPDFLDFRVLDLERGLKEQGFAPGTYDMVLATNVVHATRDLRATLGKAKELLRPNGWLVLNELTEVLDSTTVVGGLLDGWWLFDDEELRLPDSPLAAPATWRLLLREQGFGDVVVTGGNGPDGRPRGQHVIVSESDGLRPVAPGSTGHPSAVPQAAAVDTAAAPAGQAAPVGPAPSEELRHRLGTIVARCLKLDEDVDPDRPLASYGFDSLTGMKIVSGIADELGVTVPLGDFYDHPTLRELAQHYADSGTFGPPASQPEAHAPASQPEVIAPAAPSHLPAPVVHTPVPARDEPPTDHPLSEGQRALWVIERMTPGTYAYNLPLALRLDPAVDIGALRRALQSIVDRQDSLRSTIRTTDDGPVRTVAAWQELHFQQRFLAVSDEAAVRERIREEARRPFDLEHGPLLRVTLFTPADGGQVLLLAFHHIVFDGVSIAAFLRELTSAYQDARAGRPPAASPATATFADFTAWQRDMLAGPEGERLRDYWLRRLEGGVEPPALPYDRPRPALPGHRGAAVEGRLDAELVRTAREFAAERRTSLFAVLLSAFFTLLHRYTHQRGIRIGTPAAGRPAARFDDTLGYFMNMVVLQADVDPDQDFGALAGQVHRTVLEALEHAHLPLISLTEAMRQAGRTDTADLFRVAFYFQNWVEKGDRDPVRGVFDGVHQEGEFDLTLDVVEGPADCSFTLKYDPDLFDEDTVRRLGDHLLELLRSALAEPARPVGLLSLLTGEERQRLEGLWQRARRDYPHERTLTELVEEQAARRPEAIAVTSGAESLSYGELIERVDRLAGHLRARGVQPGRAVGVLVERSQLPVALLAVLKAGGCYVPLDPTFPVDRLTYMAEDAGLHLIVTTGTAETALGTIAVPRLRMDRLADGATAYDVGTAGRPGPQDTAYVIYTSGSTGRPKGVAVPHRALVNFLSSMREEPGFGPEDTLLALTTVCFDIAALELYLPLVAGGRVEIAPAEVAKDGLKLRRHLQECGATVMQATPSTWKMLLAAGWQGDPALTALCGGEALDQDTADVLAARTRAAWNLYGPTETTIWSAVARLRAGERVNLGRAVANTQLLVLDERGQLVPPGVPGELHIGGDGLATGYVGRPELTADRFVPNPFAPSLSPCLYRTGDLVRALPEGTLEYLGRADAQVKVRGYRVEPGEVEAAMRRLAGVVEAVVVPAASAGGTGVMLRGFYTVQEGPHAGPVDPGPLRDWLPEYMVPDVLVPLKEFPRTLNGKTDRKRLGSAPLDELRTEFGDAQADRSGAPADWSGSRPQAVAAVADAAIEEDTADRLEDELARLVAEVAEVAQDRVPRHRPLGELGLNSVGFTALSTRIGKVLGIEVFPTAFYQHPTVTAMAEHLLHAHPALRGRYGGRNARTAPGLSAAPVTGPVTSAAVTPPSAESADIARSAAGSGAAEHPAADRGVAVIGMAGRLPRSPDLEAFWRHLADGHDLIEEIPADRWDWREAAGDPREGEHSRSRWGGFVPDVDRFDAAFFGISPREAQLMDPQQRLVLEVVWTALEDAGLRPSELAGRRVGVFLGVTNSDYLEVQRAAGLGTDAHTITGAALSVIPNRVSYLLDLRGPSVAVDTACSSSLTAIDQAVSALRDGSCDLAIAGGVSLILDPSLYVALSKSEMLSEDGRCKAFDSRANGYVRGEGVGAVVLKDLAAAGRDGDPVHAVIRGSAVNHGGRTNSLTAPSPDAQADVIVRAHRLAGTDPVTVGYVEAHGTGTALGDPIEVTGLRTAFTRLYEESGRPLPDGPTCGLGSVKSNVGHLEAAAGMAGLFKVVLAMRHRTIPASLHVVERNRYLDLDGGPFHIVTEAVPWQHSRDGRGRTLPRRAGLSSFGFGGAGAHLVLEEAPATDVVRSAAEGGQRPERPVLLVLSARSRAALTAYAERLAALLRRQGGEAEAADHAGPADVAGPAGLADVAGPAGLADVAGPAGLADVAYTLQVARDPMPERLAIVAEDRRQALGLLDAFIADGTDQAPGVFHGRAGAVRRGARPRGVAWQRYVAALLAEHDLDTLADLWVAGEEIDWRALHQDAARPPRRVRVPTYPFERTRHWVTGDTSADAAPAGGAGRHPLLDDAIPAAGAEEFAKRLTGQEFYLRDHVAGGTPILPGVVLLEMARAADELSRSDGTPVNWVEEVSWASPVQVGAESPVSLRIRLSRDPARPERTGFEILTDGGVRPHASGALVARTADRTEPARKLDLAAVRERCPQHMTGEDYYRRVEETGFSYGPSFQAVERLATGTGEALARLVIPPHLREGAGAYRFHPALMDAALQTAGSIPSGESDSNRPAYLPYFVGAVELTAGRLPDACHAYARRTDDGSSAGLRVFDILLADEDGTVLARIERFTLRALPGPTTPSGAEPLLCFEPYWRDSPAVSVHSTPPPTTLVLLDGTGDGTGRELGDALAGRTGARIVPVDLAAEFRPERLVTDLVGHGDGPIGIVHLATRGLNPRQTLDSGFHTALAFCRAWISRRGGQARYLYLHPDGSDGSDGPDGPDGPEGFEGSEGQAAEPAHAAVSGLARSVRAEYPGLRMTAVAHAPRADLPALVSAELSTAEAPTEVRTDGERRLVGAWRTAALPEAAFPSPFAAAGAHLVTGGTGGIGLYLAERLAARGAGAAGEVGIVLTSRSEPSPAARARIARLTEGGARIMHVRADMTRREDVAALVRTARERFGRIAGVLHAAGALRDGFVLRKTRAEAEAVLVPKVLGALWLDEETRDEPLEYFAAFSSTAAALGSVGQSDYAFANAFLDRFALRREQRRRSGTRFGHSLSVNWPLWRDGGMTMDAAAQQAMRRELGFSPLPADLALDGLERALAGRAPRLLLATGDAAVIERALAAEHITPRGDTGVPVRASTEGPGLRAGTERFLRELLAEELKMPVEDIDADEQFDRYGMDSLLVLSVTRRLEGHFGALSKTLFFEYFTVAELAGYFLAEHAEDAGRLPQVLGATEQAPSADDAPKDPVTGPSAPYAAAPAPMDESDPAAVPARTVPAAVSRSAVTVAVPGTPDPAPAGQDDDIVIIGVSGRYPQADDLREFWRNLREGRDCVEEIPKDRWDHSRYFDPDPDVPGRSYSKWGGFLRDVDRFDPMFFRMSQLEAEHIDPQERIFLETVWHLMENAGVTRAGMAGSRTGVFVGMMYGHYQLYGVEETLRGERAATSSSYASVANRVSYFFDFDGPSVGLDTMCSSSLFAIHLACQAIRGGDCDTAVAGGVNISSHPLKYLQLSRGGFLSTDGSCRSFGEGGDGYVPAEGSGAVLLKRRAAAEADGDRILAVVKGSAVNHGGAGKGFSVPNAKAQGTLVADALARAGWTPGDLDYIEAHGTGTALGDPVEVTGLLRAFRGHDLGSRKIPIGSVKSNIGHAESAAGMAAVTKVLLQFRHGLLVPSLHAEQLNPNIDFDAAPLRVQRELAEWSPRTDAAGRPLPRTAAVSAFGAGGSNAHVLLEEYVPPRSHPTPEARAPFVFTLSARDRSRLDAYAERMADFLRTDGADTDPAALAHTLQTGREPMTHRLAVVFGDLAELQARLDAYLAGRDGTPGVWTGTVRRGARPAADGTADPAADRAATPETLAAAWVTGAAVDWRRLYDGPPPARAELPGYPFARDRCWFQAPEERATDPLAAPEDAAPHAVQDQAPPVPARPEPSGGEADVTRETTVYEEITLSADTPVIAGHQVAGRLMLPAVAYIDLVHQVFRRQGLPYDELELRDLTVLRPLVVTPEAPVRIALDGRPVGRDRWAVRIVDRAEPDGSPCATAEMVLTGPVRFAGPQRPATPTPSAVPEDLDAVYDRDGRLGQVYTGAARAAGRVWQDTEELIAELTPPHGAGTSGHLFHPGLLLGGAVAAGALLPGGGRGEEDDGGDGAFYLPMYVESFRAAAPLTGPCTARVRRSSLSVRDELARLTVEFLDGDGRVLAEVRGLSSKLIRSGTLTGRPGQAQRTVDGSGSGPGSDGGPLTPTQDRLRHLMSDGLGRAPQELNPDIGYYELGIDSVSVLELVSSLERVLGRSLPPTLLFEYTTIRDLAGYLDEHHPGALDDTAAPVPSARAGETAGRAVQGRTAPGAGSAPLAAAGLPEPAPLAPAPHGTRLLTKGWEPAAPGLGGPLPRPVAVLATADTRALADRLARELPEAQVLEPADLSGGPTPGRFGACVDLTGCAPADPGSHRTYDDPADWLPWVQQFVAQASAAEPVVLLGVTRGLETPHLDGHAVNLAGAARAGLYRMLQSEYAKVRSRHVDVDPLVDDLTVVRQIAAELADTGEDPEVRHRAGQRHRAVLRETPAGAGRDGVLPFPEDGTLWITGGTGGLGLAFARHAVRHWGVRRLVLTGRTRLPDRADWEARVGDDPLGRRLEALIGLEQAGARVRVLSLPLDGSASDDLTRAVSEAERDLGPVRGVIHCAGFADRDNLAFVGKPAASVRAVVDPKVAGLDALVNCFAGHSLRFFVLCSSVAAAVPSAAVGQSDYAMANAYADYLAAARPHGLPLLSVQWPSWSGVGMGDAEPGPGYVRTGLGSLSESEGTALLDHLLTHGAGPAVLPAVIRDAGAWRPELLMRRRIRVDVPEAAPAPRSEPTGQRPVGEIAETAAKWLLGLIAEQLHFDPARLAVDVPIDDFGADSIMMVQLLREVGTRLGIEPDPSAFIEHSTVESFVGWLADTYPAEFAAAFGTGGAEESTATAESVSGSGPVSAPDVVPAPGSGPAPASVSAPGSVSVPGPVSGLGPVASEFVAGSGSVSAPDLVPAPDSGPAPDPVFAPQSLPAPGPVSALGPVASEFVAGARSVAGSASVSAPQSVSAPDSGPAPDAGLAPDPVSAPASGPAPDVVPAPDSGPAPDSVSAPAPVSAPDAVSAPDSGPARDPVPVPDPVPDPVPAPDSVPAPDPVPTPQSVPAPQSVAGSEPVSARLAASGHVSASARVPASGAEPADVPVYAPQGAAGPDDIAVIGMSGRFPGAPDLGAYWRLLGEGRSAIGPVPAHRWGRGDGLVAGLIDRDGFDPGFFLLSDEDAAAMDPQALVLLEETLFALGDAGYGPTDLKGRDVGVYIGARSRHLPDDATLSRTRNPIVVVGQNYLAGNVSRFFDLRGPSVVVDTACSSALVAMHSAAQALRDGDVEAAVVGGVTLLADDAGHRLFDQRGLLSPEPAFHVFDRRARGTVLAEGAGVVVLKPLARALADGDRVQAVLKGIAVNNDGRTAGPASPNPAAQRAVMAKALARSGKRADEVTHIEANAAGSAVHDLTELKAIQTVYRAASKAPCSLGSVKPNIGHPQCAEGIAGFIKVVLMLRDRQLVPFLSGQEPLDHFDLSATPFTFARELTPWPDAPLVAAVSSFADGGTNTHAVVEGWTGPATGRPALQRPALARRTLAAPAPAAATATVPDAVATAPARPTPEPTPELVPVAVIGMAGRYPGADDLGAYWQNLRHGRDAVTEVPADRWQWPNPSGGTDRPLSRWGGFVADADRFDSEFFRVSRPEAEITDPQERLFLETCWEAIENAGYTPATLVAPRGPERRRPVGVFAGVMHKDYSLIGAKAEPVDGRVLPVSLNQGMIANRVSFFCDFHGPSMAVDTLCSSSLTTVHLAVESLARGESEVAVAGGVNLSLHPAKYQTYGAVDMHSATGRSRSFGAGGDGWVSAEGVGAVVLKPLHRAEQDGDHVYAVIRSTAVSHVGTGSGVTVPSPVAQAAVISEALERAGVDARTIGCVEGHGTGTRLGDPIEVQGLVRAFRRHTDDNGFCALGSVKSNIGHAESAGGVAGLTKAVLQLHHRTLVPSLHSETVNPLLDLENTPFHLQHRAEPWPEPAAGGPRRAGVSSYGATGSNAHIVLEEYVPAATGRHEHPPHGPQIVPLSARDDDRLRALAERLLAFLTGEGGEEGEGGVVGGTEPVSLPELAHTLQTGRVAMASRVAFVVADITELRTALEKYVAGAAAPGTAAAPWDFGASPAAPETVEQWIAQRRLPELADHWSAGGALDWQRLWTAARPRRVPLPTYPFVRERHWHPGARPTTAADAPVASVKELLIERLARTLRVTPDRIPGDAAFADLGVDAISGLSFVSEVGDALGVPLDATVLYSHTTIDRLAGHLTGSEDR